MDITWTLIGIIVSLLIYFFYRSNQKQKYWERKGVACLKSKNIFRSVVQVFLMKKSIGEFYADVYRDFPNEKCVGLYEATTPVLMLRDPKLIERILVKDFQYFVDRAGMIEEDNLFSEGLFQLTGSTWRTVRYKLSPAFTSGKLKLIFNDMIDCANGMIVKIRENLYKDYEIKEAISEYTMDVMAQTVFGIQISDSSRKEFNKMGTTIFTITPKQFASIMLISLFPKISKLFGVKFFPKKTNDYFVNIIKTTFEQRMNGKNQRNDYLQHLIKLKEKGYIEVQSKDEEDSYLDLDNKAPTENIEITERLLYGQAFQFLTAGFEPLYNSIVFCLYDLARTPYAQERVRKEIMETLEKHQGYTYDAMKDMIYLEQCIQESLRVHPLTPFLFRQCTKNYVTEDGLEIAKGIKLIIPLHGIHKDPKYFPDPDEFKPDRLAPNSIRNNFTYMPFGDGPRMCIGLRFAMVELKIAIAKVVENFKFTLSPKTVVPYKINKLSFIPIPTTKLLFNISPLK